MKVERGSICSRRLTDLALLKLGSESEDAESGLIDRWSDSGQEVGAMRVGEKVVGKRGLG